MTGDALTQANRDLGARLAALREAAGCTQARLARLVGSHGLEVLGHGSDTTWSAAFAGDQALLGRANGTVELRDLASAELTRTLDAGEGRVWSLATGSDVVAAACGDGSVRGWSLNSSWTLRLNEEERRTWSVALNGSGTRIAASSAGGSRGCGISRRPSSYGNAKPMRAESGPWPSMAAAACC